MSASTENIVSTCHGKIRGACSTTVYGNQYISFEGIPYARPPLGTLRFKSPQPAEPWNSILECTTVANKCLQYNRYKDQVEGSEDCLYLNVYVKKLKSARPLPVMVYIHGGGYNTGDATRLSWGPDYFMMKDVVLILVGYRLGPLGFLRFSDPSLEVPGNAGLKDILLALKWIKRNAVNFNGDANNITLFGHSSGSGAIHLLMLSDNAKGLFDKAILLAGYAFNLENISDAAYRLAKHIGYEGENNERQLFEFLMKADARDLQCFHKYRTAEELDNGVNYAFLPCPEPYVNKDTFYSQPIVELLKTAWSNDIPIMTGVTSCEGLLQYKKYADPHFYEVFQKHPEYVLPLELQYKLPKSAQKPVIKKVIELHFKEKPVCLENVDCTLDLKSYTFMYNALYRTLQARRAYGKAPTYLYRFDFDSPTFNLYRIKHCGPGSRGVGHVDELSYLFWMPQSFKLKRDSEEFKTIERMIDIFTAFAENSEPNCNSLTGIEWKPIESEPSLRCLNISNNLNVISSPEAPKCKIWASIYEEAGIKFY